MGHDRSLPAPLEDLPPPEPAPEQRTCVSRTAAPLRCTLTVTNALTSMVTVRWEGTSEPRGAVFNPGSATLAPGETSPTITMDAGRRCPVVFVLYDERQHK